MADKCAHMNFSAKVTVNRLEDIGRFVADVRVRCADCGLPFMFLGLPAGLHIEQPTCSVDGLEARMPVAPLGAELSPLDSMAKGFKFTGKHNA